MTYNGFSKPLQRLRKIYLMIKTTSIVLALSLLLASCSSRGAMDYFEKNEHYERAMTNLKIGTLVNDLETQVIFKAIYLNQVFAKEYQEGENFYIATYINEDAQDETKRGLHNKLYTLHLNGIKATKITELQYDDVLRLQMPLTEQWSRYYHVHFDEVQENDLDLTFAHDHLGTIVLKYAKDELER